MRQTFARWLHSNKQLSEPAEKKSVKLVGDFSFFSADRPNEKLNGKCAKRRSITANRPDNFPSGCLRRRKRSLSPSVLSVGRNLTGFFDWTSPLLVTAHRFFPIAACGSDEHAKANTRTKIAGHYDDQSPTLWNISTCFLQHRKKQNRKSIQNNSHSCASARLLRCRRKPVSSHSGVNARLGFWTAIKVGARAEGNIKKTALIQDDGV